MSQLKTNTSPLLDAEEIQSTPISSLPKSGVQFMNSPNGNFPRASSNHNSFLHIDASNLSMEPAHQMDQEDEEVILFKPSSGGGGVKNEVVSPSKTRPESVNSSPSVGSQPYNMPPLVNVASGANNSNNRGPTGWDLFASQAQQQPQYNTGMPSGVPPLSTQVMAAGQMYSPFGNYGTHVSLVF